MEEEDKLCLKIHGYISTSEDDSDFERSNVELDNRYQLFKPPPVQVNPTDHRIIEITEPIRLNKDQQKKKNLSFADILKQSSVQSSGRIFPQSTSPTDGKTLSKSQRKKKRKLKKKNADSESGGKMNEDQPNNSLGQVDNPILWCDKIDYDNKFPLLGHENKPVKERKSWIKRDDLKDALISECDTNYLYYPYDSPDFEKFMSFKEMYLNGELKDYENTEIKANIKISEESELSSSFDPEIHMSSTLQSSLENSIQSESAEENKPAKKRRRRTKKRVSKGPFISERDTNYLYYPFESPNFENFMSSKEMYLNGELKDYNIAEATTNVETEKKRESTSYRYSEIHIRSTTFRCFLNTSSQFGNIELSDEFISRLRTNIYGFYVFAQSFLKNSVRLVLQHNHAFTKEQVNHLIYDYKALKRIYTLYETFTRTSTFLQFSKDSQKESTTRMEQNYLIRVGQMVCRNMGISFSVEDAYMIVGKFFCSMNLTTEYDLSNLEANKNGFLLFFEKLELIFYSFIGAVLLNVILIVKQKLHDYPIIRQKTRVSLSDKRLINHFLKPEDFDSYSRAYSHLSFKNLEIDKFTINCLFLNQGIHSLMRTYKSSKQKTLIYDCSDCIKVNETNLFQLKLENLTENRRHHYTYSKRDLEYWQNSQESHQNYYNKSLTPVFVELDNRRFNMTFHQSRKNTCMNHFIRIWNEYFADLKSVLKVLFFYTCLKYFLLPLLLKMLELIFVSGIDIIILIVLLIFLCMQFIL